MASQIFIAYTEGDRQTAGIVRRGLAKGGIRSWAAFCDAPVGTDRKAAIRESIDSSGACLIILSPYSDNEALTEQAKRARERELPLFVLSLANIFPPYLLAEALWNATTVVADLTPTEAQVAYLVQTLQSTLPESFRQEVQEEPEEAPPSRSSEVPSFPISSTPPETVVSAPIPVLMLDIPPVPIPATPSEAIAPAFPLEIPSLPVSSSPLSSAPLSSAPPETVGSPPMFIGEYGVKPAGSPPVSLAAASALPDAPPSLTPQSEKRPATVMHRALIPILTCGLLLLLAVFGIGIVVLHNLASPDQNWKDFTPTGGEFTARMPGSPAPQTRSGDGIAMIIYHSSDGKSQYIVSYFDLSTTDGVNDPKTVLAALKQVRVTALQGTLAEERAVTTGAQTGEEFIVQKPSGIAMKDMRFRMFVVKDRVFQLESMGDELALHSPETDRFFDSFHAPGM